MQPAAIMRQKQALAGMMPPPKLDHEKIQVLLIEDQNADALLTRLAIEQTRIACHITRVAQGDLVLSGLLSRQQLCPSQMPDLI